MWVEPGDILVHVWRLSAAGRMDEARAWLIGLWATSMDALADKDESALALRLFARLGFSTDDPEGWAELPDMLTVYRAGDPGSSWTVDPDEAEHLRREIGEDASLRVSSVARADVLAYIRRESEVIIRPEALASVLADSAPIPHG